MRALIMALSLALAVPVAAQQLNVPLIGTDANGIRWTDTTFNHIEGDSLSLRVSVYTPSFSDTATALADTTLYQIINPSRYPAWLNFQFATESVSKTAWFNFYCLDKKSINSTTGTYTWSGWIPVLLNGTSITPGAFQVGLWDSCKVQVVGSSNAKVEMTWSTEVMGE